MNKFSISGIPVTVQGRLVGILTHRDLRFETNFNQPIEQRVKIYRKREN